nr:hypothetical protein [Flavobacterium sp. ALD4]
MVLIITTKHKTDTDSNVGSVATMAIMSEAINISSTKSIHLPSVCINSVEGSGFLL